MNNDTAQGILLIVILLICLALILVPFALFFGYVVFQSSKRKRIRERMLTTHRELVDNRPWLPARYASQPRYDSWFKIFPWEGAGILVLAPGSVLFLGETNSGAPVNMQFAPAVSAINWIGKSPFPNGAVSWFSFTIANRIEYFSSETGVFVFGSHRSTKELFDESNKSFSGG
ncbi:MAG: hypothetical protein JWM21_4772 [Acidobacteria bacterium]|nr:hypothetical protein [Acidobacteriota bacterium]